MWNQIDGTALSDDLGGKFEETAFNVLIQYFLVTFKEFKERWSLAGIRTASKI
jgi:hypothetical protein